MTGSTPERTRSARPASTLAAAAAVGVVLVVLSALAGLAERWYWFDGMSAEVSTAELVVETADRRLQGADDLWTRRLAVEHPSRLAVGDQGVLRLLYHVSLFRGEEPVDLAALPVRLEAMLRGGESVHIVPPGEPIEGPPPLDARWVVEPRSAGDKTLLLDLSGTVDGQDLDIARRTLTINGATVEAPADDTLELELLALTRSGLSQRMFDLLRLGVSALGFVLTYPLVVELLKRRLPRERTAPTPPAG